MHRNGDATRAAVVGLARQRDEVLARWITDRVGFPSSMVDRITPQTTEEERAAVARRYGVDDRWPVITEPFSQWFIEDDFCNGRPPLDAVGVRFVPDVAPVRADEDAAAQRQPLRARLPGHARRLRADRRADGRRRLRRLRRPADGRRGHPAAAPPRGRRPRRVQGRPAPALRQPGHRRPAAPPVPARLDEDGPPRAALAARVAGRRPAPRRCSRSPWRAGSATCSCTTRSRTSAARSCRPWPAPGGTDPRPVLAVRPVFGDLADEPGLRGRPGDGAARPRPRRRPADRRREPSAGRGWLAR